MGPAEIGGIISADQGDLLEIGIVKAIPVTDEGAAYYTAIADESGAYRLTGLPEGQYFVQGQSPMHITQYYDKTTDPSDADLVDTQENQPAEGIDFSLEPFYYLFDYTEDGLFGARDEAGQVSAIFGTVLDESGKGLNGATVYVVDELGEALLSTETFEDGMYELSGIPPGASYRVKAAHVGYESQFNGDGQTVDAAPALTMNSGRYEINFALQKSNTPVSNEPDPELPSSLKLLGNYPNPFRAATNISFSLPKAEHVSIEIYDTLGRRIADVHDGLLNAGEHNIPWRVASNARTYPSGLYFYRITAGEEIVSGSMTLLR